MSDDDDDVLNKLTAAVFNTAEMMSRMITANEEQARIAREAALISAGFREEIKNLKRSLEKIVHVLHEGNGEKPLISRVAILETKVEGIEEDLERAEEEQARDKEVSTTGKSALWAAGICTVGAIVGSILTALLQKLM